MATEEFMSTKVSTWTNPTGEEVRFKILHGGKLKTVVCPAGQEIQLPTHLDPAIKRIKGGVVVSGLAPQLQKKGEEDVPLHAAIAEAMDQGDIERLARGQTKLAGREAAALIRAAQKKGGGPHPVGTPSKAIVNARAEAEAAEAEAAELRALVERGAKAKAEAADLKAKLDEAGLGSAADPPKPAPKGSHPAKG